MFINQIYALKTKIFIPISFDLMIAYFDPYFWSKALKTTEHKCRTATLQNSFCRTRPFVKNFLMAETSGRRLSRYRFQLPWLSNSLNSK